jgi:hypothetical protein
MSGVAAVRYLLANSAGLIAVVPATRIMASVIPQGTTLPALSVEHVSGVMRHAIAAPASGNSVIDRVQVTVMATSYAQMKSILALVRAAVPNTRGTVNGVALDSILQDVEGPDIFDHELNAHFQSIDFRVFFTR